MVYSTITVNAGFCWEMNNGSFKNVVKISKNAFEEKGKVFFDEFDNWFNSADILSIIVNEREFNIYLSSEEAEYYIEDEAIELIRGFINEVFYNADKLDFVLEIHLEDDIDFNINIVERDKIDSVM